MEASAKTILQGDERAIKMQACKRVGNRCYMESNKLISECFKLLDLSNDQIMCLSNT